MSLRDWTIGCYIANQEELYKVARSFQELILSVTAMMLSTTVIVSCLINQKTPGFVTRPKYHSQLQPTYHTL